MVKDFAALFACYLFSLLLPLYEKCNTNKGKRQGKSIPLCSDFRRLTALEDETYPLSRASKGACRAFWELLLRFLLCLVLWRHALQWLHGEPGYHGLLITYTYRHIRTASEYVGEEGM